MFVDPERGSDWNSGMSPGHPLKTIQAAMDKIPFLHEQHASEAIHVFPGKLFFSPEVRKKREAKKKRLEEKWPPEPDDLNEEWWK